MRWGCAATLRHTHNRTVTRTVRTQDTVRCTDTQTTESHRVRDTHPAPPPERGLRATVEYSSRTTRLRCEAPRPCTPGEGPPSICMRARPPHACVRPTVDTRRRCEMDPDLAGSDDAQGRTAGRVRRAVDGSRNGRAPGAVQGMHSPRTGDAQPAQREHVPTCSRRQHKHETGPIRSAGQLQKDARPPARSHKHAGNALPPPLPKAALDKSLSSVGRRRNSEAPWE